MKPVKYHLENNLYIVLEQNKWFIRDDQSFLLLTETRKYTRNFSEGISFASPDEAEEFYNKPKVFNAEGYRFEDIPKWANYIAMDSDQRWFVYENRPYLAANVFRRSDGEMQQITPVGKEVNWKETLKEIK